MTRTERLRLEGKTDTIYFGTLNLVSMDYVSERREYYYEESDFEYGVNIYSDGFNYVAVLS